MSVLTNEHTDAPSLAELDEAIWYAHLYGHADAVDRWLDARLEAQ